MEPGPHADQVEKLRIEAIEAAYSNATEKALDLINQALSLNPCSARCAIEKAEIMCEANKHKEAIEFLSEGTFDRAQPVQEEVKKIQDEIDLDAAFSKGKDLTEPR